MVISKHIDEVTRKSTGREVIGTKIQALDICKPRGDEVLGPILSGGSFEGTRYGKIEVDFLVEAGTPSILLGTMVGIKLVRSDGEVTGTTFENEVIIQDQDQKVELG